MKLPLLLHYKPRLVAGPIVILQKGTWIIEAKNLIDSEVNLSLDDSSLEWMPIYNNKEVIIEESTNVQVKIIKIGTESEITIYAIMK